MLSISKIFKNANCHVVFCESHCTFQDQNSGETIGCAKMIDGLYYFDEVSVSHKIPKGLISVCSPFVKETIMLYYRRLGYLNFFYLKYLFSNLFKDLDCSIFFM